MDYVVGSVAALISGNVTPNRPKLIRRALTPTKHQTSPNVTPKSEFVEDRSIFLSPTQLKKKAIVKKSPKRIFQNPDLDITDDCEGNSSVTSPKAEKVKKHLKDQLDADDMAKKKSRRSKDESVEDALDNVNIASVANENTPKKKKNNPNSVSNVTNSNTIDDTKDTSTTIAESTSKNSKKRRKSIADKSEIGVEESTKMNKSPKKLKIFKSNVSENNSVPPHQNEKKKNKRKKKNKIKQDTHITVSDNKENNEEITDNTEKLTNKKKKRKNQQKTKKPETKQEVSKTEQMDVDDNDSDSEAEEVKTRNIPNPNAITEKDSDSEHDSDDEIESENDETNKQLINEHQENNSSDEEEEDTKEKNKKDKKVENNIDKNDKTKDAKVSEDEIKRTLFVGNVPFSNKCKKDVKKIFSKYGQIETVRIRTIPVKDARVTPKLAIIKNELHPERTTVNVYIKFASEVSVSEALTENNTVLNEHHLRVTRSSSTGDEHDPRFTVFVGNLPFAIEDETLRSKFEKCGEIESVRIIRDKKTNAGKGFGYVNFTSKDAVELALALTDEDLTIKNRILRVHRSTQSQGRKGQAEGKQGGKFQGNQGGRFQGKPGGRFQGNQGGRFQGNQGGRFQGNQGGRFQGNQGGRFQGNQGGRFQGKPGGKFQGKEGGGQGKWNQSIGQEGAQRRLMNKRKFQENGEGPPNKRANNEAPPDKKQRKEFVGMTAEKKKKHKFDKGQKKKKALSEILTKTA